MRKAEALQAVIEQNAEDTDAFLVYADYLQQQGDPRGKFILLCQHADDPNGRYDSATISTARDRYLKVWGKQLLGALWNPYQRGEIEVTWRAWGLSIN